MIPKARKKTPTAPQAVNVDRDDPDYQLGLQVGRCLRALKRKNEPKGSLPYHVGISHGLRPISIDAADHTVTFDGKTVELSETRLFPILSCLVANRGHSVKHADLHAVLPQPVVLKSIVRDLKEFLRKEGLSQLADAIKGHMGHYRLDI